MSTAVSRILGDLRDRGGLQGKDIANIVDVSTATVSRWSRGNGSPDLRFKQSSPTCAMSWIDCPISIPRTNSTMVAFASSVVGGRAGNRPD